MLFSEGRKTGVSTYGAIDPNCNVAEVLEDSYQTAKYLCEQYYLSAPDVNIEVQNCEFIFIKYWFSVFYLLVINTLKAVTKSFA